MKQICVIGNSHVVCWKNAWDDIRSQYEDRVALTFFGATGARTSSLRVKGRSLVSSDRRVRVSFERTSGGLRAIDVDNFSDFVFVGLNVGFRSTLSLFLRYGLLRHLAVRPDVDLLSAECLNLALDNLLLRAAAFQLRDRLLQIADKPVYIASTPCLAEEVLQSQNLESGMYVSAFGSLLGTTYLQDIYSQFEERAAMLASTKGVKLLLQEHSTMAYPGFTKSEFSQDGVGFHPASSQPHDVRHMNKSYGQICLKQTIDAVTQGE